MHFALLPGCTATTTRTTHTRVHCVYFFLTPLLLLYSHTHTQTHSQKVDIAPSANGFIAALGEQR